MDKKMYWISALILVVIAGGSISYFQVTGERDLCADGELWIQQNDSELYYCSSEDSYRYCSGLSSTNRSCYIMELINTTKIYNAEKKQVMIKNEESEQEIAKITLNTPQINYVMPGKDRRIAEFTIESFDDYDNVFNNLEFYNVKNNMQKFNRDFEYKYKDYYDIEVDDFEEICKQRLANLSDIEYYDCYENKTGSHTEKRFSWKDFNEKEELPKGNITIGIFTEVYPNDNVEWIPTLFNTRINEFASWSGSFNIDLMAYWKFDETSGTNVPDSTNNFDLTTNSSNWTTGLIENGLAFNGTGYRAWNDTFLDRNMTDISFSFWFKFVKTFNSSVTQNFVLFEKVDQHLLNHIIVFMNTVGGNLGVALAGQPQGQIGLKSNKTSWLPGVWNNVIIIWDGGSNVSLYINGEHNHTITYTGFFNSTVAQYDFAIGGSYRIVNEFNGTIDEFGVWNRTLTVSEISDLYNSGSGISYLEFPNITIHSPLNITYNESDVDLNVSSTWTNIDTWWYYIDDFAYNNITFTPNTTIDGIYSNVSLDLTVYVNDSLGIVGSAKATFNVSCFRIWSDNFYLDCGGWLHLYSPNDTIYISKLNNTGDWVYVT